MCEYKYIRNFWIINTHFHDVLWMCFGCFLSHTHAQHPRFYCGILSSFLFCSIPFWFQLGGIFSSFFSLYSRRYFICWLPMYSFFLWCVVNGTQAHKVVENIWISSGWLYILFVVQLGTFFSYIFFFCLCFLLSSRSLLLLISRCHHTFADTCGKGTRRRMAGYFAASSLLTGCW